MNQQPGNYPINNDRSLQQLAWAIQASLGQFKLIVARCNYPSLRDRLIARLTEISQVKIEVLSLQHSTKNLYSAMREETGQGVQVLIMIGLESMSELSSTLIGANQMRDNFRQDFPLPLVWWVDDRVYQQMMELAPDLESWATTRNFAITPTELIDFLSQTVEELFAGNLTLTWEKCEEIKWVWQGLQDGEQVLAPELKASGEYLLGLVEYSTNQLAKAINYYQSSLAFWQSSNHLERQIQTLQYLTLCYYGQTREQETQNHLHQALAILDTANRPHLIADAVEKIGVILRHFQDWQQLESLVEIALPVHQAQGNQIKVAQDYSFLAEVALARENWQEAEDWGHRAWVILSHLEPREIITPSQRVLLILSQARQKLGKNQVAVPGFLTNRCKKRGQNLRKCI
jgi:tetratricopeptide (TPR) repeat protein